MRRATSGRALVLPFVAFLAAACQRPDNPAERYERFARAARAGDVGAVWAMLSKDSQDRLRARSKELEGSAQVPGADVQVANLVLGDLAPTAPKVKSATVLRESRDRAVVAVEVEGGERGEVSLVREGQEWKVVLPGG
ncbi:MAG TPA: hypothetical protein VEB43_01395 [Anaeromyxobacter sp.]|nr:hypothetical protein [Anaeromyxobacter sp.]